METAWIQVFVLSLSECVAPAGKTVCQEQEVQYRFHDKVQCEAVLRQLIDYSAGAKHVIVNEEKSSCLPTVVQSRTYATLQEARQQLSGSADWGVLPVEEQTTPALSEAHKARLEKLPDCDAAHSVTPCKIGPIIVESDAAREVPVWRRDEKN